MSKNIIRSAKHPSVDGWAVWRRPETRALLDRLGHDWNAPTTRVVLDMPCDSLVKITHEFNGLDMNKDT